MSSPKSPSPDLFSSLQTLNDTACPPQTVLSNNTVSRARKRLRGEPVSPSPVKEKRQRVLPDALPFAKLSVLAAGDSGDDDRTPAEQGDSSFVADSPMKPPPKGGAFKLLFEGAAGDVISQDGRARSQRFPVNARPGIPLSKSQRARSMSGSSTSETPPENHPNLKMNASEGNSTKDSTMHRTEKRSFRNRFGKNDIFGTAQPSEALRHDLERATQTEHIGQSSQSTSPAQCSQTDAVPNAPDTLCLNHRPPLLPPSPPPAVCGSVYPGKGKGRIKVTGPTRKRTKLPEDSGDEQDEGRADIHVKIREWSWQRCDTGPALNPPMEDLDPVFGLGAHDRPSSPGPASDDVPGDFEVNLPDNLRRVLAISPSKAHTTRDVNMVRGVLYGERTSGYDARKGGDIWNVGEIGEATDSQAEDDWEGEPVPWETGEL